METCLELKYTYYVERVVEVVHYIKYALVLMVMYLRYMGVVHILSHWHCEWHMSDYRLGLAVHSTCSCLNCSCEVVYVLFYP
jgi:hypothetical protein